jgi:outer membrane receptor protein involved in Fe transport
MTGTQALQQGNSRTRFIRLLGITTMLAGLASPALAADDQATAAAEEEKGFEEIIVTATRTATSIQKVPISMQALSADTLQQRSVKGLTDFAALIPSVSFAGLGPGRTEVYFRGIVPAGGAYPATGYYLDDISINVNGLPDVHVYDVERLEALSGPQGTLFGAGSLAGTIRVITNKPKLGEFSGGMDLTTVRPVRLTGRIAATVVNTLDQVDARAGMVDDWLDWDGAVGGEADAWIEVRQTDDNPGGSPVWSAWRRLDQSEFRARAYQFRAQLRSYDLAFNIHVTALSVTADEVV